MFQIWVQMRDCVQSRIRSFCHSFSKFLLKNYSCDMIHCSFGNRLDKMWCRLCGKLINSNYNRHIDNFHLGKKYTCVHCSKVFTDQSNLRRHVRRFHQGSAGKFVIKYIVILKDKTITDGRS